MPLCASCSARASVPWEERGEKEPLRALLLTVREAIASPRALGARLSGTGQLAFAYLYGACVTLLGGLPLCVLLAALQLTVADPRTLGLRSTSVLSNAVFVVLSAFGAASLVPSLLFALAGLWWGIARVLGLAVRFDVLARATAYGAGLLVIPLLGPLLLPVALLMSATAAFGCLRARAGAGRALAVLLLGMLACAAPLLLLVFG